jgi:hypothetical protein
MLNLRNFFSFFMLGVLGCGGAPGELSESSDAITASSNAQLAEALRRAGPGTRIDLANRTYSDDFTVQESGSPNAPIRIVASTRHRAVLTGTLTIRGDYVVVEGLKLTGAGQIVVESGTGARITRNLFEETAYGSEAIYLRGSARDVTIDRNECADFGGNFVSISMGRATHPRGVHIFRNYVHGQPPRQASDRFGSAAIRVGHGASGSRNVAEALIEENLFADVRQGLEAISVKSSEVVILRNTFRNSREITLRHGLQHQVIANVMSGTGGGINVRGIGHELIGNVLEDGADIDVQAGDCAGDDAGQCLPRAEETRVVGNQGRLVVGNTVSSSVRLPALATVIRAHDGAIVFERDSGTVDERNAGPGIAVPSTRALSANQVGPSVP